MVTLSIEVEILPTVEIRDAAKALIDLADKLGQHVCAEFNGTRMWADPGTTPDAVLTWYDEAVRRKQERGNG